MGLSVNNRNRKLKTATAIMAALLALPCATAEAATLNYDISHYNHAVWGDTSGLVVTSRDDVGSPDPAVEYVLQRTGVEDGSILFSMTDLGDTNSDIYSADASGEYEWCVDCGVPTTYTASADASVTYATSGADVDIVGDRQLHISIDGFNVGNITTSGVQTTGAIVNVEAISSADNTVSIGAVDISSGTAGTFDITSSTGANLDVTFTSTVEADIIDIEGDGGNLTATFTGDVTSYETDATTDALSIETKNGSVVDVDFLGNVTANDFNLGYSDSSGTGSIDVTIAGDLTYIDNTIGNVINVKTSDTMGDVRLSVAGGLLGNSTAVDIDDSSSLGNAYLRLNNSAGDAISISQTIDGTGTLEVYGLDTTFTGTIGDGDTDLDIRGYIDDNAGTTEISDATFSGMVNVDNVTIGYDDGDDLINSADEENQVNVNFESSLNIADLDMFSSGTVSVENLATDNVITNINIYSSGAIDFADNTSNNISLLNTWEDSNATVNFGASSTNAITSVMSYNESTTTINFGASSNNTLTDINSYNDSDTTVNFGASSVNNITDIDFNATSTGEVNFADSSDNTFGDIDFYNDSNADVTIGNDTTNTVGNIRFNSTVGGDLVIGANSTNTVTGTTNFISTGSLTLGDGSDNTLNIVSFDSGGSLTTGSNSETDIASLSFNSGGTATLGNGSTNTIGNINYNSGGALVLDANSVTDVTGSIQSTTGGGIVLNDSATLNVSNDIDLGALTVNGTGNGTTTTITVDVDTSLSSDLTLNASNSANVVGEFNGAVSVGGLELHNTGSGLIDLDLNSGITNSGVADIDTTSTGDIDIDVTGNFNTGSLDMDAAGGGDITLDIVGNYAASGSSVVDASNSNSVVNVSTTGNFTSSSLDLNGTGGNVTLDVGNNASIANTFSIDTTSSASDVNVDIDGTLTTNALDINTNRGDVVLDVAGNTTVSTNLTVDSSSGGDIDVYFNGNLNVQDLNIGEANGAAGGTIDVEVDGDLTYLAGGGIELHVKTSGTSDDARLTVTGNLIDMDHIRLTDSSTGGNAYLRLNNTSEEGITIDKAIEGNGHLEVYGYNYTFEIPEGVNEGINTLTANTVDARGYVDGDVNTTEDASTITFNNYTDVDNYIIGDATELNEVNVDFAKVVHTNNFTMNSSGVVNFNAEYEQFDHDEDEEGIFEVIIPEENIISGTLTVNGTGTINFADESDNTFGTIQFNNEGSIITGVNTTANINQLSFGDSGTMSLGETSENNITNVDFGAGGLLELNKDSITEVAGSIQFDTGGTVALYEGATLDVAGGFVANNPAAGIIQIHADGLSLDENIGDATNNINRIEFYNAGDVENLSYLSGNVYVEDIRFGAAESAGLFLGNTVQVLGNIEGGAYETDEETGESNFVPSQSGTIYFNDALALSGQDIDVKGSILDVVHVQVDLANEDSDFDVAGATDVGSITINAAGNDTNAITFGGPVNVDTGNIVIVDSNQAAHDNATIFNGNVSTEVGSVYIVGHTTTFNGTVNSAENITVNGDVLFNGTVDAVGTVTLGGGSSATVDAALTAGNLNATDNRADYSFNGDVEVAEAIWVNGNNSTVFHGDVSAGYIQDYEGAHYLGNVELTGNGAIVFDDVEPFPEGWIINTEEGVYSNFAGADIDGMITGEGDLRLSDSDVAGTVTANNVILLGANDLHSSVNVTNLISNGDTTIYDDVVAAESIVSQNNTDLTIDGEVVAASVITDGGINNFNGGVTTSDLLELGGTTTITGDVDASVINTLSGSNTIFAGEVTASDAITTRGNTEFNDTVTGGSINTNDDTDFNDDVIAADIIAGGETEFAANLASDSLTSNGNTVVSGLANISGDVVSIASTNITFNNSLTAGNVITNGGVNSFGGDITAGNIDIAGTNIFGGNITADLLAMDNGSTTNVAGNVTVDTITNEANSDFTISGIVSASYINSAGGNATFNGLVNVGDSGTISVYGTNIFTDRVVAGTITVAGDSSFSNSVTATTLNAYGDAVFNGVLELTEFVVKDGGTFNINADATGDLNFEDNGTVILADGIEWDGNITTDYDGFGILQLEGNRTISSAVTTAADGTVPAEKLYAVNLGTAGTISEVNSKLGADNLQLHDTGTVNVNTDIDSNLNFLSDGTAVVNNSIIDGDVASIGASQGTLTFDDGGEVTGSIGDSVNSLATLNVDSGDLNIGDDVYVTDVNVNLDGTIIFADNVNVEAGTIDSDIDGRGTLVFAGTSIVDANIGSVGEVGAIIAGAHNETVTFASSTDATLTVSELQIGSGQVILQDDIDGDVLFTRGGTLTIAAGNVWTGDISTEIIGQGRLELEGDRIVNDRVTTNVIDTLAIADNGSTVIFNGNVNANTIEVMGTGSATFNTDLADSNLMFEGDGVVTMSDGYNALEIVDAGADNIGTLIMSGNTEVEGTVGAEHSLKLLQAAADNKTVTFAESVKVSTLTMLGDGELQFDDGADLTISELNANGDGEGTITFKGDHVIEGTIASAANQLDEIKGAYEGGSVTFSDAVNVETLTVSGTGSYSLNGGGTGDILFDADGSVAIADNVAWNGDISSDVAGQGSLIFEGDASGIVNVGVVQRLDSITLAGNNDTVVASGIFRSSDHLYLNNNSLETDSFNLSEGQQIYSVINDNATWGRVSATNALSIDSNSNLTVNISTSEYIVPGSQFVIAEGSAASSIANLSGDISSNNILAEFTQIASSEELIAEYDVKDIEDVTSDGNLIALGNLFYSIPYDTNEYMEELNIAMQNATNIGQVASILEEFKPKVDGGEKSAVMNNNAQIQYLAEQRIEDIRMGNVAEYGFSSDSYSGQFDEYGFEVQDYGFSESDYYDYGFSGVSGGNSVYSASLWAQIYYNHITQSTVGSTSGYDSDSFGAAVGMDNSDIIDNGIVGVSLNFGNSTIDSGSDGSTDSDITNYGVNFYSNYEFGEGVFVNTQLGYSINNIDRTRYDAGGSGLTATADYSSSQISGKFAVGADFFPVNGLTITPVASIAHIMIDTDGYTEAGAGAFNMTVSGHSENVTRMGMKFDANVQMMDSVGAIIKPSMKFGYFYDIQNSPVVTTASYGVTSSAITIEGPEPAASTYLIGAGLDYIAETDWELATDIDFQQKEGYNSYTGIARLTGYF